MGAKYFGFVLLMLWIWISFISLVFAFTVELDSELDRDRLWKITGHAEYLEDGSQLQEHLVASDVVLPPDFRFKSFSRSRGIWAVLPVIKCEGRRGGGEGGLALLAAAEHENRGGVGGAGGDVPDSASCNNNVTSRVTFRFDAMAQLLDSVQVKCNIGGNATVRIVGGAGGPVDLKPTTRSDKFFYYSVDLDGPIMQLDATVYGIGDYILVDKITISYSTSQSPSRESPIAESWPSPAEGSTMISSTPETPTLPTSPIPKESSSPSSVRSAGNGWGGGRDGTIFVVQLALVELLLMLISFG